MRFLSLFAAGAAATLLGAACGGSDAPLEPERIYVQQACQNCHGPDRRGSVLAPPLVGLAEHWTEAGIVEYLADPVGYAKKVPRLAAQAERYAQPMPPYAGLDPEAREALASWLLAE